MEADLLENFKPMIEAYRHIERLDAMLQQPLSPELHRVTKQMQAEAVEKFLAHLDHEVDLRLVELMDMSRRELAEDIQKRQAQQARQTPQLLAAAH
jgi:hypothetical protein